MKELKCPKCGKSEISAWQDVLQHYNCSLSDDGYMEYSDNGTSDAGESTYYCEGCGEISYEENYFIHEVETVKETP